MTATIQYEGNLRCNAIHLQSGSPIETDAPTDNKGKGVKKHMLGNPRRIGRIDVVVTYPANLQLSAHDKDFLKDIGDNCPVMKSIHPDIEVKVEYK